MSIGWKDIDLLTKHAVVLQRRTRNIRPSSSACSFKRRVVRLCSHDQDGNLGGFGQSDSKQLVRFQKECAD